MKKWGLFLFVLTLFLITTHGNALAYDSPLEVGWVISWADNTMILHTKNGGRKWEVQGKWLGCRGKDISAVDKQTAWAALGCVNDGMILHTTNGGVTWTEQTLPAGMDSIKGIRGLTRHEAWAVSLKGTVLHTTDGGENWNLVDLDIVGGEAIQVNRMNAIGSRDVRDADRSGKNTGKIHANVWIVDGGPDEELPKDWGMIHTLYNGETWRREKIQNSVIGSGGHMVSAYSPRVVWAAKWADGHLYRTTDGRENWNSIEGIDVGANDIDDMCAYSADALWFVQYEVTPTGGGNIYHVNLENADPVEQFNPVDKNGHVLPYKYEGLTCVDDQTAVVVRYTDVPELSPEGIILLTNDGGQTWERQPLPVDDAEFWKVSFVGARR